VRVYRGSDGKLVAVIPESMPPFALSPQGKWIAVTTRKGILLRDLEEGPDKPGLLLEDSEGLFTDGRMRFMNALTFSPDGNSIVAARNILRQGNIFTLDVWSAATGKKEAGFPVSRDVVEHSGLVSGVAFSAGGRLLASASHDHSIRLWEFETRQCLERLYGNPSEVWALSFSADGRAVLSGAKDGTVRLWPTNTPSTERLYAGNWTPLKFSKDGRLLAALDDQSRFVLLNLGTGEPEASIQLSMPQFGFLPGAVSDDLRVLADPLPEGGIRLWDIPSMKSEDLKGHDTPKSGGASFPGASGHGFRRSWAAISPDGTALLDSGGNNSVMWRNLQDLSEAPSHLEGRSAFFSRNGQVLATLQDRSVKIWSASTRTLRVEVPAEADLVLAALALSDDGSILAAGSNPLTETENAIRLWDTRNGKLLGVCKGHTQGVRWLAFAPDGETLASVSDDSTLRFWNIRTQQELLSIRRLAEPIREIVFSPDGNWLAAKTASGLRLLDASQGRGTGN
jgi:WD40 repeat protein